MELQAAHSFRNLFPSCLVDICKCQPSDSSVLSSGGNGVEVSPIIPVSISALCGTNKDHRFKTYMGLLTERFSTVLINYYSAALFRQTTAINSRSS